MHEDILTLTKKLIEIPSVTGDIEKSVQVLKLAEEQLRGFPLIPYSSNQIPSLFFSNKKNIKQHKIILNAHLDIVPGSVKQFTPFEKNGKLYGRGAYDMKAAAAVMIVLFKKIANQVSYPLGLQLVTDEEIGGINGTNFQIENGITGDFVIAGENTNLKINNKAKGLYWLKLIATGKEAHGAYPWLGENALLRLYSAIETLYKAFPPVTDASWKTTINLAKIETPNSTFNKVPDTATAFLDVRFIPEEQSQVLNLIKTALPQGIKTEIITYGDAQFTDENNPYINLLKKQIEIVTEKPAEMLAVPGASDVRFYEQKGNAAVCLGPIGHGHHADEEWVDIKSLEQYYKILKNFLLSVK